MYKTTKNKRIAAIHQ